MVCTELSRLLQDEKKDLKDEIDRHKYFLSQKLGHDVGFRYAENDFIDHYLDSWAQGYKAAYCNHVCHNKCKSL